MNTPMNYLSFDAPLRTIPVSPILVVLCLAFVLIFAIGCSSNSDPGYRVRMSLPAGWEENLELGKATMDDEDLGETTVFFAGKLVTARYDPNTGKPATVRYDPNILVMTKIMPRNSDLKEIVDSELDNTTEGPFTKVLSRRTSSLAGFPAEVVTLYVTRASDEYDGRAAEQTFFIKGVRMYIAQCMGIDSSVRDFDLCRDTVKTLEFYE